MDDDLEHPTRNLLNGLKPSDRLYRFLRLDRFLDLVSHRILLLRKPHTWDDPFENFLSKTTIDDNGQSVGFNLTNDYFGQCWTLREECDGMWRNYCSLDCGVRIGTTSEKLIQAIWNGTDTFTPLQTFVGRVRYLDDGSLKAELAGCSEYGHPLMNSSGRGIAQMLLIKRTEFDYEEEVRALVSDDKMVGDTKTFVIDPRGFIDSITFAPKMNDTLRDALANHLVSQGFSRNCITRSTLYDPWKLVLKK